MHVVFARSSSSTTLSAILFMLAAYNLSPLHHHCSMRIQATFLSYCDSLMKRCLMRDTGQGCSDWLYFYGQGACTCSFEDNNVWLFLPATKQLYKWYFPSVRLSHLFDYVSIIVSSWNFQELLPMTKVRSMQKVKVTEITTQLNRFWPVTPVWINIWWWNDAYSLMLLRRGAP